LVQADRGLASANNSRNHVKEARRVQGRETPGMDDLQASRLAIGSRSLRHQFRSADVVMTAVRPGRASVLQLIAEEVAPQLLQG
jgi:hypothetical protein